MLTKIISPEQGVFLPGRSIFENINLTQETIHSINKPSYAGNVVMKIDMAKAYDSVDWNILLHILRLFGFSKFFCSLIRQCVTFPWLVMNDIPKSFFKSGRGLRQGTLSRLIYFSRRNSY